MEIYVGNISPRVRTADLKDFFKAYDKNARFDVVRLKGEHDTLIFGFVIIPSDRLARKAIRKLNMKMLLDRKVIVREFHHRASGNDRRSIGWRNRPWENRERRGIDRRIARRPDLDADISFEGYAEMARKNI